MSKFEINLEETFPNLDEPPIAEAAIYWRAEPLTPIKPSELLSTLKERLSDYPNVAPQHELTVKHQVGPQGTQLNQSQTWEAFQLSHQSEPYVCQFRRDGLVVSRLPPYEDWTPFRDEALRLWAIYREITEPPEVKRVGVRYINLVPVDSVSEALELLQHPPEFPGDLPLPLENWVHQSRFSVPGENLLVNLVQTVQAAPPDGQSKLNLILDFDIFSTNQRVSVDDLETGDLFPKMRWLKNRTFFRTFAPKAIEKFGG